MQAIYLLYIFSLFFSVPLLSADLHMQIGFDQAKERQNDFRFFFPNMSMQECKQIQQDQCLFEENKKKLLEAQLLNATPEQLKKILLQDFNDTLFDLINKNAFNVSEDERFAQKQYDAIQAIKKKFLLNLKSPFVHAQSPHRSEMPLGMLDQIEKIMRSLDIEPNNIHINYGPSDPRKSVATIGVDGDCSFDQAIVVQFNVKLISLDINSNFAEEFQDTEYFKSVIFHELAHLLDFHCFNAEIIKYLKINFQDELILKRNQELVADIFAATISQSYADMLHRVYLKAESNRRRHFSGKHSSYPTLVYVIKKILNVYGMPLASSSASTGDTGLKEAEKKIFDEQEKSEKAPVQKSALVESAPAAFQVLDQGHNKPQPEQEQKRVLAKLSSSFLSWGALGISMLLMVYIVGKTMHQHVQKSRA